MDSIYDEDDLFDDQGACLEAYSRSPSPELGAIITSLGESIEAWEEGEGEGS